MTNVKNIPGVNPVLMNHKIKYNKNQPVTRPVRYSLTWPDCLFRYLRWQKNGKHGLDIQGYVQEQPWRKACSECELARALAYHGWSMNIAIFSTWDLREQGRKFYVAIQLSGERKIGDPVNVFSQTMSLKVIRESFLPRMIPNIRYLFSDA